MQKYPIPESFELSKIAALKQAIFDGKSTVIDFKIGPDGAADLLKSLTPAVSSAELRPGVIRSLPVALPPRGSRLYFYRKG